MREKLFVPSVRDSDLHSILEYHGLARELEEGRIQCPSCGETLTWENVGAILVKGGQLSLCCGFPKCIEHATRRKSDDD